LIFSVLAIIIPIFEFFSIFYTIEKN